MKLSDLFTSLYQASEFTSPNSLATTTGQTQPFVAGLLSEQKKESMEKMDVIFEALTPGVSVEQFLAALELVRQVKASEIEKEQII